MENEMELKETAEETAAENLWYADIGFEEAKAFIKENIVSAARSFIAIGYYLKHIRDHELFLEDGFSTIWEFAKAEYGLSMSTASRYMKMNDRFSQNGNSPYIQEAYKDFGKSQLQEMLYLDDSQLDQVTPDTQVMEIRNLRKEGPEEEIPEIIQVPGQMGIEDFPEAWPEPAAYFEENREPGNIQCQVSTEELFAISQKNVVEVEEVQTESTGKCIYRPDYNCTLTEIKKRTIGDGEHCTESCCWECVKHGECRLECYSSARRPDPVTVQQEEELLSAYGTPKKAYPEDSLITTAGCEGWHDCFSCHLACEIRQEECYCVESPMGNPFPCEMVPTIKKLREEIGSGCQMVNPDLADHRAGDREPVPCCKECVDPCEYICSRAVKTQRVSVVAAAPVEKPQAQPESESESLQKVIDAEFTEIEGAEEEERTDLQIAQHELERAKELLRKCLKDLPDENNVYIRGMKIKVAALASLVCDMEDIENPPPKPDQTELPPLKNNDQRAAFVDAYETWPLWIETERTGERYYRYDLEDGTSMVVKVYHAMLFDYKVTGLKYEDRYSEGYGRHEYYLLKPGKFFKDCEANRSSLIDKLKEIQKKER